MTSRMVSLGLCASLLLGACGGAETRSLTLQITHGVDDAALVFDDVRFTNDAGNVYSVERLEYYVSNFVLHRKGGADVVLPGAHYCNARSGLVGVIPAANVPVGDYTGITLLLGVDPTLNVPNGLPLTLENTNMVWPVAMGGGYHFLKLEGHFRDASMTAVGYAMHLGKTENAVAANVTEAFSVTSTTTAITLHMNINDWFRGATRWDFNVDGNYTMDNMAAMQKLRANGAAVFSLGEKP